ncbi:MAG: hypothetical protein HZA91_17740 [Verrucomicrobia bacterium]|nr:hypothetical protein [Verrucomicrobiota bacterium]
MKTHWLMIALMSTGLAVAQEPSNPPPPKDQPRREEPPPPRPEGDRPEARRPLPPREREGERVEGRRPLPPPEGERAEGRRPLPAREGERAEGRRPLLPREGERVRPPLGQEAAQDFQGAVRRELGPLAESGRDIGGPLLKERMEQARQLFENRRFEEGREVLRTTARQLREMKDLKERDPERFKLQMRIAELDRHSNELGQKVRNTREEEAKKQAATELKEVLNKLFDLRQEEREKNVQQIERDLKELRESLEQRKAKRDEIIQHRFDQLTGKAAIMEW